VSCDGRFDVVTAGLGTEAPVRLVWDPQSLSEGREREREGGKEGGREPERSENHPNELHNRTASADNRSSSLPEDKQVSTQT
jgi:hypothetical protein